MSIYIPDVEMPSDCGNCFANWHMFCNVSCRKLRIPADYIERPIGCPLHELPPHGDLIDRDAVVEEQKLSRDYHAQNGREESLLERAIRIVKEAPVIIPADSKKAAPAATGTARK